jgi:hypothetical protein
MPRSSYHNPNNTVGEFLITLLSTSQYSQADESALCSETRSAYICLA